VIIKRWGCQRRCRDTIGGKFIFLQKVHIYENGFRVSLSPCLPPFLSLIPKRVNIEDFLSQSNWRERAILKR
jgi:hypothetical protein